MEANDLPDMKALAQVMGKLDTQFSVEPIPKYMTVITVKEVSNGFVTELDEIVPRMGCARRVTSVDLTIAEVAARLCAYYKRRDEHEATTTPSDHPVQPDATGNYF